MVFVRDIKHIVAIRLIICKKLNQDKLVCNYKKCSIPTKLKIKRNIRNKDHVRAKLFRSCHSLYMFVKTSKMKIIIITNQINLH